MSVSARQLNRATLARQLLLRRERLPVVEGVRRVVAMQAQEPASPYVALWNRLDGFNPAELDAAFEDRAVVKATLMRITLHAVHAGDYTAFHQAMVANLRASRLSDRRFTSTGLTAEDADAALPHLVGFTARRSRTVSEISDMLSEHLGDTVESRLWWALKTFAPLVHAPTDSPWSFGRRPSFRKAPGTPRRVDPERSMQRLIWRYLEGFGPASAKDFGQFALQQVPPIRAALEALAGELITLEGPDGQELFDVPGGVVPDEGTPAPPRLMAMWDSILLAYVDRSRVIPDEYRKLVIRRNGDVLPTLLVDGYVAGVWRMVDGSIEATAFHRLSDDTWTALAEEARSLLDLVTERDPRVYGRYRNWWSDMPAAEVRILPS